jgi:hypothetical protein
MFTATHATGCSPSIFANACTGKACGGLGCGACDDRTDGCDQTSSQCLSYCAAGTNPGGHARAATCDGTTITNPNGYAQACPQGPQSTSCGTACVDTTSDPSNCGGCGKSCGIGSCQNGACSCQPPTVAHEATCASGGGPAPMLCGGTCVDTNCDATNCGGCAQKCPKFPAVGCRNGACACLGTIAGSTTKFTLCGSGCVDDQNDVNNCGNCGNKCASGATCSAGVCTCPAQQTVCGGTCVDEQTDVNHCGTCGNACGSVTTCCAGQCVDLRTDLHHCGQCANACSGPYGIGCCNGVCSGQNLQRCPTGSNCGSIPNMCAGQPDISCAGFTSGNCTAPQTCGGGGTPNVCGP